LQQLRDGGRLTFELGSAKPQWLEYLSPGPRINGWLRSEAAFLFSASDMR
jgi:hypothetical protein